MVKYIPAPDDLSKLNPIQRYMQKGSLDWSDWIRLGCILLAYWFLRPHVQRIAKKWSSETQGGEEEQEAYKERRAAAAIDANKIRSGKKEKNDKGSGNGNGKTLGDILDQGADGFNTAASSSAAPAAAQGAEVKNRKQKKSKGVSFAPEKTEVDKTLDWEDESEFEPSRKPLALTTVDAGEGDIKQWMEKWTS